MTLTIVWLILVLVNLVYFLVVVVRCSSFAQVLTGRWQALAASLIAFGLVVHLLGSVTESQWIDATLAGTSLVCLALLLRAVVSSRGKHGRVR